MDMERGRAILQIPEAVLRELLAECGRMGREETWAWLRGIWALRCSVYLPKNGYYVTLSVKEPWKSERRLLWILRSAGVVPGVRRRGECTEYMLRSQDDIVTCLSRMGFVRTSLALEEINIFRSLRGRANKLVNCDSANIAKSIGAAREQMEIVRKIESEGLWDQISPAMAEVARARGANPSASLRELGQMLSKPVSKSTVEYRWRKLESFINEKF
ncbi:MAG: DNA-binding protein WhiA [Synergistaceae bacterium]|nr:DNA-binding protein WhiA [Synergistaceae bacterium]